jgi:hypothetical protein
LVVRNISGSCPGEVLSTDVHRADGKFNSFIIDLPDIGKRIIETGFDRKRHQPKKISGFLVVGIDGAGDTVPEETEVETDIELVGFFPGKMGIGNGILYRSCGQVATENIV